MKRALFFVLLLLAAHASAQETYSAIATAAQVTTLRQIVAGFNQQRCERWALSVNCTQAQACVAASAVGGASCTNAQARAADARIYGDSQPEREDYVLREILVPAFQSGKASLSSSFRSAYCLWWDAQTQTTKDAELVKAGFPAGETACPMK